MNGKKKWAKLSCFASFLLLPSSRLQQYNQVEILIWLFFKIEEPSYFTCAQDWLWHQVGKSKIQKQTNDVLLIFFKIEKSFNKYLGIKTVSKTFVEENTNHESKLDGKSGIYVSS